MCLLNTIETKQCSLSILRIFLGDPTLSNGLAISSQQLSTISDGDDDAIIGSFILFTCTNGFVNTDNNLNVTCTVNGLWTTFPTCIPTSTVTSSMCLMNS